MKVQNVESGRDHQGEAAAQRSTCHAGEGLAPERLWLELLSRHYRVIAPSHGYGASPLIDGGAGGIDDVVYLYLDLAGELGLEDGVLVGADLGGWIAAVVRSTISS